MFQTEAAAVSKCAGSLLAMKLPGEKPTSNYY